MTANTRKLLLALALTTAPVGALAQDAATTETETTTTETTTETTTDTATDTATDTEVSNDAVTTTTESDGVPGNEPERNNGFPWGLLGLLGLAGLAGRNRAPEHRTEVRLGGPTDGPRQS